MLSLVYEGQRKVVLKEVPAPEIGDGEVLLRVDACGLCGSDIAKIDAKLLPPVPLGHEVAGTVEAVGRGVKKVQEGDEVVVSHHVPCLACHYCRRGSESMCREFKRSNLDPGGFSQKIRISARHVEHVLFPVPEGIPPAVAAMTEPLACVLRNLRRLNLREEDCAAVIGLGFIGLLTAKALALKGVRVLGFDVDPGRVKLAQKQGVPESFTGKEGRSLELIQERTVGRGADALIVTAGPASLVPERFEWVRDGGAVNVFAGYPDRPTAPIDLDAVYHRELTLLSSYSPALEDLSEAHRLIAGDALDLSVFTRSQFALDEFDEAMRQARGRETLKAILLPQRVRAETRP